uniref:Signal induced proliferation associated 1 like 3 n=1 Tax=Malurus cyaneus samueli TaxID=2593467 RepID=A0A8C5TMR9_9PASS
MRFPSISSFLRNFHGNKPTSSKVIPQTHPGLQIPTFQALLRSPDLCGSRIGTAPTMSADIPQQGTSLQQQPLAGFRALHRLARRRSKDVEFQEGWPGTPAPLRQRSSSEVTLSECDPEETAEPRGGGGAGLFREYGSTSSIDVQGISEQSFFDMLNEFRTKKPDRRAATPERLGDFAAGSHPGIKPENRNGPRDELAAQSKEKPRRRCPKSDAGGESIFKKLRSGRTEGETKDPEEPRVPEPGRSWMCRKSFAHYDAQSILFDLSAAALHRAAGTQRRNTTTGASAASAGSDPAFSSTEDLNSKENLEHDVGDNTSNELLLSCPHFRNEIGGGAGERDVSFSKAGSPGFPGSEGVFPEPLHAGRPTNAGISVLEVPKEQQRNPERLKHYSVEHVDFGARYYRDYFHGKEHSNYFGVDDKLGPVAVSIRREKLEEHKEHGPQYQHRLIFRTSQLVTLRGSILEDATPTTAKPGTVRGLPLRDVLEYVVPELNIHCLRLAFSTPKVTEQLLKLDEQGLCRRIKVGILYCKAGQSSEEEMYNNEEAGPALDEFLTLLGEKVSLKSFTKYAAQLDTKTDSTGTHSLYTTYQDYEIMFHVSTMLPYTPNNRQQLLRKRHIGNDIVTIIFQEPGALPFTPQNIRSHFQHVFIIVRAHHPCTDSVSYSVAVTRSKDVPPFGPPLPPSGVTFRRSDLFRAFLLAKAINAENAAHKSHKFRTMATRTRQEYLRDLAENYVTNTPLDTAGKFNLISLASKKKEKCKARPSAELESAGAVSWRVSALDFGRGAEIPCVLGISNEFVVLMDLGAKEVVFNCFTGDVIGWSAEGPALRIYHGRGDLVSVRAGVPGADGDRGAEEVREIVQRLKVTTPGCATVDMTLRRNGLGQLGFHVHPDGSVAEVEEYGFAWQAGLRRGSRLLEVCKVAAVALSHEQMIDLLRTSVTVTVGIVPPHDDGTPRRGWSESLEPGTATEPKADPEPFPEPFPGGFRAPFRSGAGWHRSVPTVPKRPLGIPGIPHREPQPIHGKSPIPASLTPFPVPFPNPRPPSLPHSQILDPAGVLSEPLWHVPAPSRIPGKRLARPDPAGKDSPNRHCKNEPPYSSHSTLSSTASSEGPDPAGSDPDPDPGARGASSDSGIDSHPKSGQKSQKNIPKIPKSASQEPAPPPGKNFQQKNGNSVIPESVTTPRPLPTSQISASVPKSFFSKNPGRAKGTAAAAAWKRPEELPDAKNQVNVFGQPRLRASLRDLRSPRRLPKSSIEDDLKRLILMDNSCPEPDPAPPLQRTLSDESLCGGRRDPPGFNPNSPSRDFPETFPGGFPSSTLPGRRGPQDKKGEAFGNFMGFWEFRGGLEGFCPVARLDPGLIPLPDTAGLEWATLVNAAKAYEGKAGESQNGGGKIGVLGLENENWNPSLPAPLDLPGKVSQLEAMLKQLHSDLEKEKQDKVFLQAEVANLRQNNRRLQQESSSAARQLRRFARIFSGAGAPDES